MQYDLIIVGAGVTGTALLRTLSRFGTNIGRIAVIEKELGVAQVNSHPLNNAQTSHDGGTETNYSLEHALEVQHAARLLRSYVEKHPAPGLFERSTRMVLGVGASEVELVKRRFEEFGPRYPDLTLVGPKELAILEPKVMEGRDPLEPVAALVSDQGYAINYQKLAESFVEDAKRCRGDDLDFLFDTAVKDVRREGDGFVITTKSKTQGTQVHTTRAVVFAAGAYSLHYAHKLGVGTELALLSVAGSFYSSGPVLNGKVYRVQIEGLPFAAIHGDRDVYVENETRFGPTTKPVLLMERHRYMSALEFMRLGWVSVRGFVTLLHIMADKQLLGYVAKNWLYDLRVIGPRLFVKEARKIIPTLTHKDLTLRRGAGGIRPQIVNLETHELIMGDKTLVDGNAIFNTTPSPGASVCLANAERDAQRVVQMLGNGAAFDHAAFERDHELV